ncbi:hypothetical protein [Deinococcus navajonensis]|uniref:Uncharacterized protein n=1 Tax=Deinococcus navajonensis TaxID=309884 RepID=A0ABV8XJF8_9DEIO
MSDETSAAPTALPTRVLLSLRYADGGLADAEVTRKAALYLSRQTGVVRAEGNTAGSLELQYDSAQVTLTELTRALGPAGLRVGIV